jgi:hypothetical protein
MLETIEMIDVKEKSRTDTSAVLGWQVSLSELVWARCVTLPKGAEGQTEGGRLHDLLGFIRFSLKELAGPRRGLLCAGFGFSVNVVNDHRKRSDYPDGLECPGQEVPLEVLASFGEDGSPRLVVVTQSESRVRRMRHD